MPTPPPVIYADRVRGTVARTNTYSANQHTAFAYTRDLPILVTKPIAWIMEWLSNQLALLFLDLTPEELATWIKPAKRRGVTPRVLFIGNNLKRCRGQRYQLPRQTRTYKPS